MVSWIGQIIDLNAGRVRINADARIVSTDGFLLNLTAVLLRLCAPFIDDAQKVYSLGLLSYCLAAKF